jgi:hypothetical protein
MELSFMAPENLLWEMVLDDHHNRERPLVEGKLTDSAVNKNLKSQKRLGSSECV